MTALKSPSNLVLKKLSFITVTLLLSLSGFSQNTFPNNGNAGVGTASPTVPFEIGTTLNQSDPIFKFGNPQQFNQIIFKDRDFSSFLFGIQSNQIKIGTSGNDHKIMSIQYNAHNIELWPTVAINSPANILLNAGQNVGIGNSNPQYKLDVNGSVNASQYYINGSPLSGLTGLWLTSPSNTNNIYYNTGNVGIGTNAPNVPFQIATTLNQGDAIFNFGNPQQNNQIIFRDRDISSFMYGVQANQIKVGASGADHKIMSIQANSQNIEVWPTVAINSPNNILINAGQNVGIGNSNPQYKLDVTGTINATQFLVNGNPLATLSGTGDALSLPVTASLGVGTNNPQYKLDVVGDARISNNLYVGGGIVITDNLHAATSVTTGVLTTSIIQMGASGVINGNTNLIGNLNVDPSATLSTGIFNASGDVTASTKLTVGGDATFNGVLKLTGFVGNGSGNLTYNNLGQIVKGPPILNCIPGSPQWSFGGDNFIPFSLTDPPLPMESSVGTCNNYDFALKSNNTIRQTLKTDGKIGFGTQSPLEAFHFANGKVAIGDGPFASPDKSLTVNGDVCFANYGGPGNLGVNATNGYSGFEIVGLDKVPGRRGISVEEDPTGDMSFFISGFQNGQGLGASAFRFKNGIVTVGQQSFQAPNAPAAPDVMSINNVGQLALTSYVGSAYDAFTITDASVQGVATINFKVKANGTVYSREIFVQTGAFPDYVFAKEYKLMSLDKLKEFIAENKHLPNMPTAKEVRANGMNLGEISRIQVEKLEELTLYVIQLKEEIELLKKENLKKK